MDIDKIISSKTNSVTDFLGKTWHFECMGCAMGNNELEIPGGIIYEEGNVYVCQDPAIPIIGFLTINIRRHVKSIIDLTNDERNTINKILVMSVKALKKLNITSEVSIVQEERAPHFHIWIFPNHELMNKKFGKGTHYFRDIMNYYQKNNNDEIVREVLDAVEKVKEYFKEHDINE